MRILVTRPAREALAWVAQLEVHGLVAQALPLIEIAPVDTEAERAALAQAWRSLVAGEFAAVLFASPNAVDAFFAARPAGAVLPPQLRGWAPGPATRVALLEQGLSEVDSPPDHASQFDSEHLWPVVRWRLRAGDRVLGVRGADATGRAQGRDWLRTQVEAMGGGWQDVVAYRRCRPDWDTATRTAVQAAAQDAVWLFSSSEAVRNLGALLPDARWDSARAVATHPRIAEAAEALGIGRVTRCLPTLAAVLASIESLR